jgi:hypothetical protein
VSPCRVQRHGLIGQWPTIIGYGRCCIRETVTRWPAHSYLHLPSHYYTDHHRHSCFDQNNRVSIYTARLSRHLVYTDTHQSPVTTRKTRNSASHFRRDRNTTPYNQPTKPTDHVCSSVQNGRPGRLQTSLLVDGPRCQGWQRRRRAPGPLC